MLLFESYSGNLVRRALTAAGEKRDLLSCYHELEEPLGDQSHNAPFLPDKPAAETPTKGTRGGCCCSQTSLISTHLNHSQHFTASCFTPSAVIHGYDDHKPPFARSPTCSCPIALNDDYLTIKKQKEAGEGVVQFSDRVCA